MTSPFDRPDRRSALALRASRAASLREVRFAASSTQKSVTESAKDDAIEIDPRPGTTRAPSPLFCPIALGATEGPAILILREIHRPKAAGFDAIRCRSRSRHARNARATPSWVRGRRRGTRCGVGLRKRRSACRVDRCEPVETAADRKRWRSSPLSNYQERKPQSRSLRPPTRTGVCAGRGETHLCRVGNARIGAWQDRATPRS
jgi:hypothetical protein